MPFRSDPTLTGSGWPSLRSVSHTDLRRLSAMSVSLHTSDRGDLTPPARSEGRAARRNEVVAPDARGLAAVVMLAEVRFTYGNDLGFRLWDGGVLLRGSRPGGRDVLAEMGKYSGTAQRRRVRVPSPNHTIHVFFFRTVRGE